MSCIYSFQVLQMWITDSLHIPIKSPCLLSGDVAPVFTVYGAAPGFVCRWPHQLLSSRRDLKFTKGKICDFNNNDEGLFFLKEPKAVYGHLRIRVSDTVPGLRYADTEENFAGWLFLQKALKSLSLKQQHTQCNYTHPISLSLPHFPFPQSVSPKAEQNNSPPVCLCLCQLLWPEGLLWHPVLGS